MQDHFDSTKNFLDGVSGSMDLYLKDADGWRIVLLDVVRKAFKPGYDPQALYYFGEWLRVLIDLSAIIAHLVERLSKDAEKIYIDLAEVAVQGIKGRATKDLIRARVLNDYPDYDKLDTALIDFRSLESYLKDLKKALFQREESFREMSYRERKEIEQEQSAM